MGNINQTLASMRAYDDLPIHQMYAHFLSTEVQVVANLLTEHSQFRQCFVQYIMQSDNWLDAFLLLQVSKIAALVQEEFRHRDAYILTNGGQYVLEDRQQSSFTAMMEDHLSRISKEVPRSSMALVSSPYDRQIASPRLAAMTSNSQQGFYLSNPSTDSNYNGPTHIPQASRSSSIILPENINPNLPNGSNANSQKPSSPRALASMIQANRQSINNHSQIASQDSTDGVNNNNGMPSIAIPRRITTFNPSLSSNQYIYDRKLPPRTYDILPVFIAGIIPIFLQSNECKQCLQTMMKSSSSSSSSSSSCLQSVMMLFEGLQTSSSQHHASFKVATDVKTVIHSNKTSRIRQYIMHKFHHLQKHTLQRSLATFDWLQDILAYLEYLPYSICISTARKEQPGFPLVYVNRCFEDMTLYSRREILGQNCRFLQGNKSEAIPLKRLTQALSERQLIKVAITNFRKDGSSFVNLLAMKPIFDRYGQYAYVLAIQLDMSASNTIAVSPTNSHGSSSGGSHLMRDVQAIDDLLFILPNLLFR